MSTAAGGDSPDHYWRGGGGPPGMYLFGDPEMLARHLGDMLDLDATQQQKIANIITAAKPETDSLRQRMRDNFEAMGNLDPEDSDYDVRLQNLAEETGRLATEATLLHGRLRAEIQAELTPEQRQELQKRKEHMRHFENRPHPAPESE